MSGNKSSDRAIVRWGVADRQLSQGERWMALACLFFFAFVTMYGFIKVSPVLMDIGQKYGMGLDTVGNVMAFFNIAGIIMAFPAIWVMRNLGVKFSLIVTGVITLAGSLLGIYAPDAGMFLLSRVLEGAGMGMVAAIGPNVMPRLFPLKNLGLVMGIWSVWTCPGILLASLVGPQIVMATGSIDSLWWLSIAMEAVAIVWMLACFKMNAIDENELALQENPELKAAPRKNRNYILSASIASFSFIGYAALFGMFQNFYPTFLQANGLDMAASMLPATISTIVTIPISFAAGIVIDKFHISKWALVGGHALLGITMGIVAWNFFNGVGIVTAVLIGCVAGVLPVALRTLIPFQVSDPRKMDYVLGIMAFVTNLGSFYSGPFGAMADGMGWQQAGLVGLLPIAAVFTVLCLIFVKSERSILKKEEDQA